MYLNSSTKDNDAVLMEKSLTNQLHVQWNFYEKIQKNACNLLL